MTGASAAKPAPKPTDPAAAGSHQSRGQRRAAKVTAAAPTAASPPWIAVALARSMAQSRHDWVASPTRSAR